MRFICTILATLTICCCFAAEEATKLPRDAQTAMDSYNKAAAKLEDDYKHKLGAEREKLYGLLDKASKAAATKGDADAIVAIKAEQKKLLVEAEKDDNTDMLGDKLAISPDMVGKWLVTFTNHNTRIYEITADGKMIYNSNPVKLEFPDKTCIARLDYENTVSVFKMEKGKLLVDNYNPAASYPKGKPDVTGVGEKIK